MQNKRHQPIQAILPGRRVVGRFLDGSFHTACQFGLNDLHPLMGKLDLAQGDPVRTWMPLRMERGHGKVWILYRYERAQ